MLNKVFLIGNLGQDPEIRYLEDGTMMVHIRLATNDLVRKNGSYEKITEWHSIYLYGKLAEFSTKLKKGDKIFVEGKIRYRVFEIDGKHIKSASIVAKNIKILKASDQNSESDERYDRLDTRYNDTRGYDDTRGNDIEEDDIF